MHIFVTGGSGYVGSRLVARLLKEGHRITALSNSSASDEVLQNLGVAVVRGGLDDIDAWASALKGHDAVIHAAAPVLVWGEGELFYKQITLATTQLYKASTKYHIKRFIFISSESVLQDGAPLLDIDETKAYPKEPNSYYGKAKMLAEQALLAQKVGPTCIILRPTFIWGEHSRNLEIIAQKVRSKAFVWIDQGRASMEMVHVANVVEAVRLSLTHGRHQEIYFVTDDHPMPIREFFEGVFKALNVTSPKASLPGWLARPLAAGLEAIWRVLCIKATPPLSRFQLDLVALPRRYKLDKIKAEFGYEPVISYQEGIQRLGKS